MDNSTILTIMDIWSEIVDTLAHRLILFTPLLYKKDDVEKDIIPHPLAISVLFAFDDRHFLVTCAHVFKGTKPEDVGVVIGNTFCTIGGQLHHGPGEDDDAIDVAILEIAQDMSDTISKEYRFVDLKKINCDHAVSEKARYLIAGYPGSWNKPTRRTRRQDLFVFLSKATPVTLYAKLNLSEHTNLLIQYQRRKIKDFDSLRIVKGPDPHGLSGCGLWHLPRIPSLSEIGKGIFSDVEAELAGIMTEYRPNSAVFVSTRIHIVTELLRVHLNLDLPPSNICRLS